MTPAHHLGATLALLATLLAPVSTRAEPSGDDDWVRLERDAREEPLGLQVAIGRYEGTPPGARGPIRVDLVGAVHVGDVAYYERLNRRFPRYDVVLYELVAPRGTVVPRGGRVDNNNLLGAMQNGMKSTLGLEHQLEMVDYTRPNFVHADMSPKQLFESMEKRDEGFLQMYFRMLGQGIAEQTKSAARGDSPEMDLMRAALADPDDWARQLKITTASQMTQLEGLITSFGGKKGSTLIHERNRVALEGLSQQITEGRREIAVFYGAGHLSDMDARLRRDFGLRQTGKEWLTSWDLRKRP